MDHTATPPLVSEQPLVLPSVVFDPAETQPGSIMPEVLKELEFEFEGSTARTATMEGSLTLCSSTSCSSSGATRPTKD